MHAARLHRLHPAHATRRHTKPGLDIHLDHIRRRATGMPRALDHLHGPKRRHPHLDAAARLRIHRALQQKPHRQGDGRAGRIRPERRIHRAHALRLVYPFRSHSTQVRACIHSWVQPSALTNTGNDG